MNPNISALAWTLIHFLWEGSAIAVLLAVALRLTKPSRSNVRYLTACAAMVLMLASAAATFLRLSDGSASNPPGAAVASTTVGALSQADTVSGAESAKRSQFGPYLPWLVYLWIGGVLALSVRTGAGFVVAQRLKRRQASPLPAVWEERFRRLAQRLDIARKVRACESAIAGVPAVVGWLRPVVLVPTSALMGLPVSDVEALLAHELAHIRRHDYLVNLLQTGIETLLFYHPAVWWTGQQIRAERENCCDDLAVAVCGDVLTYARALTRLEQMRVGTPAVVMAANSGSLLARIRRLVRPNDAARTATPSDWITGVAILLSAVAICAAGYVPLPKVFAAKPAVALTAPQMRRPVVVLAAAQKPDPAGSRVEPVIAFEDQDSASDDNDLDSVRIRLQELRELTLEHKESLGRQGELAQVEKQLLLLQAQVAQNTASAPPSEHFIEGLSAEGFKNLDVDDLISFKIHGVTPEFIRHVKAAGFQPTPDELVSMKIHGVDPDQIAGYKAAGVDNLSIDDLVSFRIHGATPEFVQSIRAAGYSKFDADDIVSLRIHGVTPEFAKEIKALSLGNPSLDDLVSMKIHGVTPEFAREMKALNLRGLDLETLVEMRIHGVTTEFVREAMKRGFKDLDVEKIIKLKQFNIL